MNQRRLHGVDSYFHFALAQFLDQLKDRQHGVDLNRVVARHRDEDAGFFGAVGFHIVSFLLFVFLKFIVSLVGFSPVYFVLFGSHTL